MATVATIDLDEGAYTVVPGEKNYGEVVRPQFDATLTHVRVRHDSPNINAIVRVYRRSDRQLLTSLQLNLAAGWNSVDVGDVALAAGVEYMITCASPALTYSNNRQALHSHGIFDLPVNNGFETPDAAPVFPTNISQQSREYNLGAVVVYNRPPAAPGAFSSPVAGQVVNESVVATFGPSSDADGDGLVYGLDLSRDNRASWTRVYTGPATSVTVDTSQVAATTAAVFRVYANDGTAQGPTTESPVFTIQHNQAPTVPDQLTPNGVTFNRTTAQRLAWRHNDPNPGDGQSKYDLEYKLVGAATFTRITVATTETAYTAAANFFAAGDYEWRVRTYDSQGLPSPWSASAFFTAATPPPGANITSPANGSTVGTSSGLLAWSFANQQAYEVRKLGDNGGQPDPEVVLYQSGVQPTQTARTAPLEYPVNNRFEHLQVRVQDRSTGLWSDWSSVRVLVSYTPPGPPSLALVTDNARGRIITNIALRTRPNLLPDDASASFEDGTPGGWTANTGSPQLQVNNTAAAHGTLSLVAVNQTAANDAALASPAIRGLVAGQDYVLSFSYRVILATGLRALYVDATIAGVPVTRRSGALGRAFALERSQTEGNTMLRTLVVFTAPSTGDLRLVVHAPYVDPAQTSTGNALRIDAVQVEAGTVASPFVLPSSEPEVARLDLYRRETAKGGEGIRIGVGVPLQVPDPSPASGVDYEYRALATATNGASVYSPWTG